MPGLITADQLDALVAQQARQAGDFLNPYDTPFDKVVLAGVYSPGVATIVGASSPRRWDVVNATGVDGARLHYTGYGPAKFTVQCRLYDRQAWRDWYEGWEPIVMKRPTRKFTSDGMLVGNGVFDIGHPWLWDLKIWSVVIEDVEAPVLEDDTGVWLISVKMIEYKVPETRLVDARGSASTPKPDAVDQRILANTETIKKLHQQLAGP